MFWVKDRNSVDIIIPNTNYILSTKKERRLCPNFQYYFRNVRLRVYICIDVMSMLQPCMTQPNI